MLLRMKNSGRGGAGERGREVRRRGGEGRRGGGGGGMQGCNRGKFWCIYKLNFQGFIRTIEKLRVTKCMLDICSKPTPVSCLGLASVSPSPHLVRVNSTDQARNFPGSEP